MSSYIVSEQTIHRIITHIDRNRDKIGFSFVCGQLRAMGYDLSALSGLDALGTDLFGLNHRAMNQRYNESNSLRTTYGYQHERVSELQVLKSLQCLMYQCSEGDVPASKLFEWLESYEHSLMRSIIDGLPEYGKAVWG